MSTDHAHHRIDALSRRVHHLEEHLARLHEHLGLGPLPQRPATDTDVESVRRLLQEGKEAEALQLHRDLTGEDVEEAREALASLRAGF